MSADTVVDFYWRPGCGFCSRLERALVGQGVTLRKHDIWENAADAAVVRSIANGNETVPTVVVGPHRMVNPSPARVLETIAAVNAGR